MKTKHTFLFTMLLGLCWVGFLFAYSEGPAANGAGGVNGVFGVANTCDQAGCHNSFPLNSGGGGTLTLAGLPSTWTPGQTYPLIITVPTPPTAILWGFQLSAVFDSTTTQAGTLTKGKTSGTDASRISIDSALNIQFAEHNANNSLLAPFPNTFYVNWTAPPNTSGGVVRFNLAGNAANHNQDPSGDYIYTLTSKISPGSAAPPDFSLAAVLTSSSITAGTSTTATATVGALNGFTGAVALSVSGLPTGATGAFSSSTITTSGTSTLTITTTTNVAQGTYPLTVTGVSGTLTHTASLSLMVTTPPGSSSQAFSIVNLGGSSLSTDGSGNLGVGYSVIQPATGKTTPAGVEIIGYRSNNILVSETGVPASPLLTAGRIYAEVNGPVNTGLAIANPNNQTANISFYFTDINGVSTSTFPTTIPANGQVAKFLNQGDYAVGLGGNTTFQGTFSFTSDQPVSVIALRGFTNERSDFLISTLPVVDTNQAGGTGTQFIPHFAAGLGYTTQLILLNPGSSVLAGNVMFFDTTGAPVTLTINGTAGSQASYSVPARSSQKLVVTLAGNSLSTGSVQVVPTGGGAAPTPLVVFSYKPSTITVTEAGAPANAGTAFRMYVESSGVPFASGNIQSGIAVANTTATTVNVTFSLFNLDGTAVSGVAPVTTSLAGSAHVAEFLAQIFSTSTLPQPFKGVLRVSCASPISMVGLRGRYNERLPQPDFLLTTTPPTNEANAASSAVQLFPHLVNGGGYTTQFILFSGTAGQASSGILEFFNTDGTPLFLILN